MDFSLQIYAFQGFQVVRPQTGSKSASKQTKKPQKHREND
jgi:hypothetical protein